MATQDDRLGRESAHLAEELPTQRLAQEAKSLLEAFAEKVLASVGEKVSTKVNEVTTGLLEKAEGEGGPGVKAAISGVRALNEGKGPIRAALGAGATGLKEKIKGFFGGGKGKKGQKVTNIVETLDIGAPLRLVYDQWTQLEDFPNFMKKVEHVERPEEEKSNWKAQVWWSHRSWQATVLEQVPDDHIVWRSKGAKGYVDGAVSFSELAPNLTRICLVMEYHPQGLFEHTGNLWRAPGRRARLEFKHFRRHTMVHAILKPDEIEGWRGEVRDGEVVKTHEEAIEEEKRARAEEPGEEGRDEQQPRGTEEAPEGEEAAEEAAEEEEPRGEREVSAADEGVEPGGAEEAEEGFAAEEAEEPGGDDVGARAGEAAEPGEDEAEPGGAERPGAEDTGTEEEDIGTEEAERPRRRQRPDDGEGRRPRPARRAPDEEDQDRPRRQARRRPGDEGDERPRRPARRRPEAGEEERPVARRPRRRPPERPDRGDEAESE